MLEDILKKVEQEVKTKCESPDNFFGEGIYYHIVAVVENAVQLAREYGADLEVVTLAAWLHDYASITDYKLYKEHHIHGANMAGELLKTLGCASSKVELVQKCILNHRGSVAFGKGTMEEICVADADAISHFDSVPSLLYLAYTKQGYSIQEGADFVANKLRRSFNKLSARSKAFYKEKYDSAMRLFNQAPRD